MAERSDPRPSLRTLITLAVAVGFVSILLVGAYTSAVFSPNGDPTQTIQRGHPVPTAIKDGGPILDTTHGQQRSYHLPDKTIALTFDDGPDARWTPEVLAILRKHQVHATFFVLGKQVTKEPDIMRSMVREGHEIGIHTFTHPDLSQLAEWRRNIELSLTQLAIAGTTGKTTLLLREPYSSVASSIDDASWQVIQHSGRNGYLVVVSDNDSRDWAAPDVPTILRNATPDNDRGSVALWHDAGGNRSRTVAALDRFIPTMLARGYRFTTVSEGLNLALGQPDTAAGQVVGMAEASTSVVVRGTIVTWIVTLTGVSFRLLWLLFIAVGVLTVGRTLALFVFAGHHVRRRRRQEWSWGPPVVDPVSVVVPAFNEKEGIAAAVRSLAGGDYPTIEVIVVDDGSTDDTADLVEGLGLANVRVIRTPNSGKPSALNTGIQHASHDLIVMVDGDTVFERESIRSLVQPFGDSTVGAVAGNVKIGNRTTMVAQWQHIEYVIGFNLDRRMYDILHCMPTVPGAIGAFRKATLIDVGGVSDDTLAEDTDLTMAICRAGWHVVYEEKARARTEAPTTLGQLWKQRYRWSYGTMQAMWKHRAALLDRSSFGLIGLPMLAVFGIVLPLFAPLFDVLAIYGAVALNTTATAIAWFTMLGVQAVTAVLAFVLDKERLRPLWVLPLQQFMYRQTMYLVAIQSVITAFTGARLHWQKLRRTGLAVPAKPVAPAASQPVQIRPAAGQLPVHDTPCRD
ncbi:MAG: bifunctional polysaccharide deacetylase/glycosyltransferase family 2 protein [Dactylosporangium sp.]|nr:bifunctional polysaccharide deacetylase/glycosyltransferase family 2 protein [Dactylosporangium sp.]